ncbi:MAG: hypothetical protein AB7O97_19640 [Planctomycetota bacterium]
MTAPVQRLDAALLRADQALAPTPAPPITVAQLRSRWRRQLLRRGFLATAAATLAAVGLWPAPPAPEAAPGAARTRLAAGLATELAAMRAEAARALAPDLQRDLDRQRARERAAAAVAATAAALAPTDPEGAAAARARLQLLWPETVAARPGPERTR